MDKEYQKLLDSFASIDKKLTQIKGDKKPSGDEMMDWMKGMFDDMYSSLRYAAEYLHSRVNDVHSRVDETHKKIDDHTNPNEKTHPPFLKTPTQVKAYLKSCGMDKDVDVKNPTIYARASKNCIEVDLSKKKI